MSPFKKDYFYLARLFQPGILRARSGLEKTCKSMELRENHEKGPRWSWARNQMGNVRLVWPIRAVAILAWLLMASSLMAEIRDVRKEIAQQTKQYIAQHFPDGKMPPKHDFSKNQPVSKGQPQVSDHKANTINGPTPGGIGYGIWYDNTALLWTNFTIADYYVIAPPAIGRTVSWLYLTSTCRAQLGTESLVAYTSSTSGPQFWIYDWSQTNSPWQVMIDLPDE